ncbi:MAG: sugar ABC transporter permease [Spirochaetales bacterium]|nr:sugar ABC transporter permease [Spirochaetales bacterium]
MSDTVKKLSFWQLVKGNIRNYSMFLMLAVIVAGFAILTGGVNINSRNVTNIFIQNSYILVLAVGMVLVIIIGNIDLSVGSVAAFTGALGAMIYNTGLGILPTILLTMLIGAAIGCFLGYFVAFIKIPAFIVTLAGMLLFRGLTYIITNVTPVSLRDDSFRNIASGSISFSFLEVGGLHLFPLLLGAAIMVVYIAYAFWDRKNKMKNHFHVLPMQYFILKLILLSLVVLVLCYKFADYRGLPTVVMVLGITVAVFVFVTQNTVFGRYIYAVGGNSRSAKLSGINSEMVTFFVHVNMGMIAGLSGIVFTAYMNSALPQAGNLFELDAIAACFIGGASASGGIGTIMGAITGGLVMGVINNGMSLMNIGADWQYVVKASVLLLAVWYDIYTRKKAGLA